MRPQSAKAKGRRLQQEVCETLVQASNGTLEPDDIRSTSMGAPGEDILLSPLARKLYPFTIECKNVEKLNIWQAIDQAKSQNNHKPMVAFKKNGEEIYVAIKLKDFLSLYNFNNYPNNSGNVGTKSD